MSDLTATNCGCGCNEMSNGNSCCSWIWILLLLSCCGGCGNNGSFFGDHPASVLLRRQRRLLRQQRRMRLLISHPERPALWSRPFLHPVFCKSPVLCLCFLYSVRKHLFLLFSFHALLIKLVNRRIIYDQTSHKKPPI